MIASTLLIFNTRLAKKKFLPFNKENRKLCVQFIIGAFFIGLGIWFIKHETPEIIQIKNAVSNATLLWVVVGLFITIVYFVLQGLLYVASFAAINAKIELKDAVILFLKRNFISVFLPAGGFSSLLFFNNAIKKKGNSELQIHLASGLYAFIGILSVVLVAIPVFIYTFLKATIGASDWYALLSIIVFIIVLISIYRSLIAKGYMYTLLTKWLPKTEIFLNDIENQIIDKRKFFIAVLYSVSIEIVGIAHLYVAMIALHFEPSLLIASIGYIISMIFLIISPFMRGLGAVEASMSYILIRYGFGNVDAIAIAFLYRIFEFWTPLFAGILIFASKINKVLMRIIPAFLLLGLGIINIISVLTPAINNRLVYLKNYLPLEAIHASNYLVFTSGLFLLVTASFMLKGLRMAWWFALALSIVSFVGNLTKAIDYEEAIIAFVVILILIATRKEYYVKTNPKLSLLGLETSILSIIAVLVYGTIGFYFLDKKHFDINFSLLQSIRYTLQNYFLVGSSNLVPLDSFANHFLMSIKISGFLSLGFLIYTLTNPYVIKNAITDEEKKLANELIKKYGNSSLDYFKTYFDKLLFISQNKNAFISYRLAGNYAVVLENPVAKNEQEMKSCIVEFDHFCYECGLKSIYYRISEKDLSLYQALHKKHFFLGQEGIVNLSEFSLEGNSKKSLRNAMNKIVENGFKTMIYQPPIKDGILQKLEAVSDEWLKETKRTEIIFSQGLFNIEELKHQTIITVENKEEKIIAFLNIIPDSVNGEATYDLIRKTADAPNGVMDFILIALFNYLKSQNYSTINLGLVPMSGIDNPKTIQDKSMKYAYEKVKSFSHYKGLRNFKEKFSPAWHNQYVIFSDDYDLIQVPRILSKVIKP
ncbi:lysylphosphatidylglycerol synthetase family protein [Flavobacterium aquariorum]|uniref:Phosphatidylglycerol lysyltransferase n=1 Tax=Flavobacterium aquariorum TaxID=2217670 RepID=A0A2W7TRD3_9FLAO|nr:phosphatidylglycerol lysyltransferase domain-containing protein [Flavobacterium aquariorum]PZX92598.1 lysylphosphatidylglycerol synthetase family protein [Flavobacterium aquariorum]